MFSKRAFILAGIAALVCVAVGEATQEKTDKHNPQPKKVAGPFERGPREGSPGVTYSDRAAAPRVDPPKFADLRIYSVTSDGKSRTIHGFNKTGFTLALASDDRITRTGFHPSVTFADQFAHGAMTAGKLSGSGNVWVARGPAGKKGPAFDFWLSSCSRSTKPPVLPEDGKSVIVPPGKLKEGREALWLNFQTDKADGVSFLIVTEAGKRSEK